MRLKLAIVVLLVAGVGYAFHEHKASLERHLGSVATQLGGRHVHVHCQGLTGDLLDVTSEAGTVGFDASGIPADHTDLKRPICDALRRFPHDVRSPAYGCVLAGAECPKKIFEEVLAVHTLAHEVWHLHGITTRASRVQRTADDRESGDASRRRCDGRAADGGLRARAALPAPSRRVPGRGLRKRWAARSPAHRSGLALGATAP